MAFAEIAKGAESLPLRSRSVRPHTKNWEPYKWLQLYVPRLLRGVQRGAVVEEWTSQQRFELL